MTEDIEELKNSLLIKAMQFANDFMGKLDGAVDDKLKIAKIVLKKEGINHPILEYASTKNICKLRFEIFKRDGFRCRYCGREAGEGVELRVDHVDPKSNGGSNEPSNLVTACHECNAGKSDVLLTERSLKKLLLKTGE